MFILMYCIYFYFNSDEEAPQFYNGNEHCPILRSSAPCFSNKEAFMLILEPTMDMVCTEMPIGCKTTSTFLLDTSYLQNALDVRADDNGKFRHNGRKTELIGVSDEGDVYDLEEKSETLAPGQYNLHRSYWAHSSNSKFKRRITELEDHKGLKLPLVILQYVYNGDPQDIKLEPHKNAKKSSKPFYGTAKSMREKIAEKAKRPLGPSSIYDELYEGGGGVIAKSASCTVPRDISQVKYERAKLRKQHSKDTLAELIQTCKASKGEFVHALQVSPSVRAVLATKSQLEDLVKFCCNPEEFSVFSVDVTYDIGEFFVTTTTYKHLMLVDRKSGSSPTLPGPFMIHTNEAADDFHYFASTLKEQRREVDNILFVGSDRQKALENGLSAQLPIAHFLACTKHVQDNITRKMGLINITGEAKTQILADIFGDRRSHQKGLIDSETGEEFDAKLLSLKEQWDEAEEKSSHCEEPQFYTYFLQHISSDMKAKMLLFIRRSAGLGDNFYYNNSSESINSSLKKEIAKQKQRSSPGKPSKCSYGEFIDIAETFVGKYRRNVHRAVKGDGPYQLARKFSDLEVTEEVWRGLSQRERVAKIASVDQAGANAYQVRDTQAADSTQQGTCETSSSTENSSSLPVDFNSSGLPQTFQATWNNADSILKKRGVTKVSGTVSTFAVISLTYPTRPHLVNNGSGRVRCDCDGFKQNQICSHGLAVACMEDILEDTVSKWVPNLLSLMQDAVPKRSGKKPGPQRIRPSRVAERRDVSGLEDRVQGVESFSTPEPFYLKWLEGSRITTCYGCGNKIRAGIHDPLPPDPYDVVICRKQIRGYTPRGSAGLRFSMKPENVFFHLKNSCVAIKCSDPVNEKSLIISDEDKLKLKISHRNML